MAKKRSKILVAVGVLLVLIVGITRIAMVVLDKEEETVKAASVVAVDTEYLEFERLTIFNGEFLHFDNVVDYVEGDPGCLYPYETDVVGTFVTTSQRDGKTEMRAILANGEVVHLETRLHRIPRSNGTDYEVFSNQSGNVRVKPELDDTLTLIIHPIGGETKTFHEIVDYCVAYDTIYWMDARNEGVVWSLDWYEPDAKHQVYCEGAYGVSHHMDEAEGALVAYPQANYEAYGRYDIYSPYGDKR